MKKYRHVVSLVEQAQNIVITTHLHPDADGVGSQVALGMALLQLGKNVTCVNEMPLSPRYKYLDAKDFVISSDEFIERSQGKAIDLIIVVDTNSLSRIGTKMVSLVQHSKNMLFVDHHPAPKQIMALHCIDTSMAATGQLVGHLIEAFGATLNYDIALALYTAIIIDTSSFRYPTVSGETHRLIASLLETGVAASKAYNLIYGTKKLSHLHLLGSILTLSQTNSDETIAWISLSEKLMATFAVVNEDTHSFVNHLLVLDNIKIACMFRESGPVTKVSLRSSGTIDVGILAESLGGGGHNHSAATIVEGELEEVTRTTIAKLEIMLKESEE
jgi:bifunctional oligoribonuclease and PAP phosphatase NrnA